MDTAKVVVRNVQRDCRNVIIKFLEDTIGEPRKSPLAHTERCRST
jgi:hypothetical protein